MTDGEVRETLVRIIMMVIIVIIPKKILFFLPGGSWQTVITPGDFFGRTGCQGVRGSRFLRGVLLRSFA